jgi:hypothetical protein
MLEPYLKQLQVMEMNYSNYNVFDFDFMFSITSHQKLDVPIAILLLDTMSKVYFNDQLFA